MSDNTQFKSKKQEHSDIILPKQDEYAYYTGPDGNFYKMDYLGVYIQINPKIGYKIILVSNGWENNKQILEAPGVINEDTEVLICPTLKNDKINWNLFKIYGSFESENHLSFECDEIPTENITVNIKIL